MQPSATIRYRVPYADTDMVGAVCHCNHLTLFERRHNEFMNPIFSALGFV